MIFEWWIKRYKIVSAAIWLGRISPNLATELWSWYLSYLLLISQRNRFAAFIIISISACGSLLRMFLILYWNASTLILISICVFTTPVLTSNLYYFWFVDCLLKRKMKDVYFFDDWETCYGNDFCSLRYLVSLFVNVVNSFVKLISYELILLKYSDGSSNKSEINTLRWSS